MATRRRRVRSKTGPKEAPKKREPKKRSSRRIFKGFLFLVICGVIVGILVYSPLFLLRDVRVQGSTYLSREELMEIGGVHLGQPLFQMDTIEVTHRLLRDLRIEEAIVRRRLPDALEFSIRERTPVATVACDYGYLDLDRQGKVIDGYKTLKKMPIPMITGVTLRDMYIGDDNQDETVQKILQFLQKLDVESLNQISEVAIVSPDSVVAYTTKSVQIRLGTLERLEEKAQLTQDFLENLKDDTHEIEFVDFSYTSPFIKLAE